jgi:uncharacterized repeat protein (TIGR01451 family)
VNQFVFHTLNLDVRAQCLAPLPRLSGNAELISPDVYSIVTLSISFTGIELKRKAKRNNLGGYINEAANPYDDNDIEPNLAPNPPQYPTADTNAWPNPSSFLIGGVNGGNVSPNHELEYAIYFLSAGNTPAPKVLLCDRVPDNTTFIPTAFNSVSSAPGGLSGADRGIVLYHNSTAVSLTDVQDGDTGQYFPPGVDPKTVYPQIECGGTNSNGAIVVNLGDIPNATGSGTPPSSFGYIRFRGKVK